MSRPRNLATLMVAGVLLTAPVAGDSRRLQADAVLEWNAIMVATVAAQNPFAQARFAAITQLAVFEAVNAINGSYVPYLGTIDAPSTASPEAAAVAAAHAVLTAYFPAAQATLDAARSTSLSAIPDGAAKSAGIAVGEAAAAAMIALRTNDGSAPPEFHQPVSLDAGEWQPTPGCPAAGGVLKHWRNVTPFGVDSAAQFRSEPPPLLTDHRYARDFNEVREVGGVTSTMRPQRKTDIARFYNATLAVATWNPVVGQIAAARGTSLARTARILALLNMAISDGLVSVMETKYAYTFWRPETAIQRADEDGNARTEADPSFQPLINAPCFPSYGSAHATASYAARRIAEAFFGEKIPEVTLSSAAVPGLVLDYSSFEEITDDIDDARVYGGIHFRFDQRAGAQQGRQIGDWVFRHHLRVAKGGE
jgi:hypothetical protein